MYVTVYPIPLGGALVVPSSLFAFQPPNVAVINVLSYQRHSSCSGALRCTLTARGTVLIYRLHVDRHIVNVSPAERYRSLKICNVLPVRCSAVRCEACVRVQSRMMVCASVGVRMRRGEGGSGEGSVGEATDLAAERGRGRAQRRWQAGRRQ